jgi:hypothetical protein
VIFYGIVRVDFIKDEYTLLHKYVLIVEVAKCSKDGNNPLKKVYLNQGFVWNWSNQDWSIASSSNSSSFTWCKRLSLQVKWNTILLCLCLQFPILLDTLNKFQTTVGVLDVLYTQINSFFQVSVSNNFMANNSDRGLCNIVDDSSFT